MIRELCPDQVDRKQLLRLLGYSTKNPPQPSFEKRVENIISTLPSDLNAISKIFPIISREDDETITSAGRIKSPTFSNLALKADSIIYALVTAGPELDKIHDQCEDTVDALIIDAYGSVIVEQGVDLLLNHLAMETKSNISLPFSPGYCDLPLSSQKDILGTFGENPLGIQYHKSSFMMSPIKTISFVAAAGSAKLNTKPCSICNMKECSMRRN